MALRTDGLPQVRIATRADEDEVMVLCRALHHENGLFTLSEEKVRMLLHRCFNRDKVIVGVIGPTGRIEATTCLMLCDMAYTNDWHIAEIWNHVDEKYRHTRDIDALIEFTKDCQHKIGIPVISGIITNNRVAGKVRKYRQHYGYPAGAFFVYGGKWADGVRPSEEDFMKPLESRAERRQRERKEHRNGAA